MSEYVISRAAHFGRLPEWLLLDRAVSSDAKVLYTFITTFDYGRTGQVWCGREKCAQELGWSVRTVTRNLNELEEHEAIIRHRGRRETMVIELVGDLVREVPRLAPLGNQEMPKPDLRSATTENHTSYRTRENEKRRKRRPPVDFVPTEEHQTYAKKEGLDLDREREGWLLWCEASGKTYLSLNAAFSTWLRHTVEYGRGSTTNGRRRRTDFDALQ